MPKFVCGCGRIINLSIGWSEAELALIPERTIESIGDALDSHDIKTADDFYNLVNRDRITVYRCPDCRRLHVESEPGKLTSYMAE